MVSSQARQNSNGWKTLAIGLVALIVTAALVGGVVAYRSEDDRRPEPAHAAAKAPERVAAAQPAAPAVKRPSTADIEACNAEARDAEHTTGDTVKGAVIGGAVGAGVGAAGGAIADGGHGAGRGAGIGALVGATAGTLYGLNEASKNDARAAEAYRACMARRGL